MNGCDISSTALGFADDHYNEVTQVDIERESLAEAFSIGQYECVVCLELLEHLFDPSAALAHIAEVLEPDGVVLASFPNFVFYKHRLDVLRGSVPAAYTLYADAEHIQNFTIESFTTLLQDEGFSIEAVYPDIAPPRFLRPVADRFPRLFARQYVVEAQKE